MCLKSTYFSYGGEFFEQREGAAMGSPVSAVVADLYMEFFEELALRTAPTKPCLWKRYVRRRRCIVKEGTVEELLTHLNNVQPSIRFTVEVEKDGRFPFLDTLLRRRDDGSLDAPSTENRRTQTGTWTSTPTIQPRSRGDWSSACSTDPEPSPLGITTCGRKNTISPES